MGSSEDPSLVNNVDELGLVYQGLTESIQIFAVICNFQEMSPFCLLYPQLYIILVWIVENIRE